MPVYNEEKHISEAINSVINQTFVDWELVIVNDASTDNTKKISQNYCKKNKRIKLINHNENKYRAGALNTGIKNSKGKYITFLDGDDIYMSNMLEEETKFLEKNMKIDLVYGNMKRFNEEGDFEFVDAIEFKENPKKIMLRSVKRKDFEKIKTYEILSERGKKLIPGCSVMMRREIFKSVHFDEDLVASQDYDLWFKIIGKGFKLKKLNILAYRYRIHKGNVSKGKKLIASKVIKEKLKKGIYFK